MLPLFFSRQVRAAMKKLPAKTRASFKKLCPANVVLHVCASGSANNLSRSLLRRPHVGKKERTHWASQRIRQEGNGVVLAFPMSTNLIHAGQQMPAQSWLSSLWFCKETMNGQFPLAQSMPNMVATGQFTFPVKTAWAKQQSFLSGSDKFPGFAVTHVRLPPKVTPEVYTTSDGSKCAKFIIPGITSADHLAQTLTLLSDLFAPVSGSGASNLAAKTARAGASEASAAAP